VPTSPVGLQVLERPVQARHGVHKVGLTTPVKPGCGEQSPAVLQYGTLRSRLL